MGDDSPEKKSTDAIVESAKDSTSVDAKVDSQTTEAQVDAAKDNADAATVDQTKGELGDFVSSLTVDLENTLVAKYGQNNPETDRILDKVKDLAKVGWGLKIKGVVNSVIGFFGIAQKFKPDLKIPTQLTDMQEKISPLAEKIDTVEKQISDVTSGNMIEKALLQAQGIDIDQLQGEQKTDTNIDTALGYLEQQAQQLKQQKNITTMSYKMGYAKLLQTFISSVKGVEDGSKQQQVELPNNESHSDAADHSHDEDIYEDIETGNISIDAKEFVAAMPIGFPIVGMKENDITSNFGPRKAPKSGASTDHKGIDIGLPVGTQIVAPADGKIISVKEQKDKNGKVTGAGKYIEVDHGSFVTRYFHLNTQDVQEGDIVKKGDKIATLGNTGNSTGPHLHYEIRDKSEIVAADKKNSGKYKAINPEDFWDFDGDGKVVAMDTYKDDGSQHTEAA